MPVFTHFPTKPPEDLLDRGHAAVIALVVHVRRRRVLCHGR